MHIPRIYLDQVLNSTAVIEIHDSQAHHLLNVLRIRTADPLILFNGTGGEYKAEVSRLHKRHVEVHILEFDPVNRESSLSTHLLLSLLKRDKMNQAITRAVELGVSRITPIRSENVSVSIKQQQSRVSSWQQSVQSATEQSGRTQLARLQPACSLEEAVLDLEPGVKLVAQAGQPRLSSGGQTDPGTVSLLIGPEGGLNQQELAFLATRGFQSFGFGTRTLRAETAPAALLALIQYLWADH
jgi:16S rRNA (uracil1498-N3)-methyltransferase